MLLIVQRYLNTYSQSQRETATERQPEMNRAPEKRKDLEHFYSKSLIHMVGVKGFEPSTPCTPCKCATRLRHTPSSKNYNRRSDPYRQQIANFKQFQTDLVQLAGDGWIVIVQTRVLEVVKLVARGVECVYTV